jgi:LmbE family N-acetylglucosaminyl deacetylase
LDDNPLISENFPFLMNRAIIVLLLLPFVALGQASQPGAARVKQNLKRLNFLGSVLYVAAHPDDENTRVITYLMGERFAATAYLSMTRGDGGQNLIGPEMGNLLGLVRTQELIAARKIDGGQQFFTRAIDFGYSKSADETFRIWNKDEILSDVVRVYRTFQPDVILTRFPPDERAGHSHHTASAIVAQEAFELSGQATAYPNQLNELPLWKPKRVFTNTGRFFSNTIDENTPGILTLNVGGYNALLGQSYSEIAAASRSQHKSQGFGAASRRGDAPEYFEQVKGDPVSSDIFEGINTTWSRVKGGEKIKALVDKAIREFDLEKPYQSIPTLVQIRKAIQALEPGVWKDRKLVETEHLIRDCLGLYVEVASNLYQASPEQKVVLTFEVINRSPVNVSVKRVASKELAFDSVLTTTLTNNVPLTFKTTKVIQAHQQYSDPYWLKEPHGIGLFTVNDASLIGKPENDPAVTIHTEIQVNGEVLNVSVPVIYKWTDPVKGELYRPFEIVPPVFLNLSDAVMIFKDQTPRKVTVLVKSSQDNLSGNLTLEVPKGWQYEPVSVPVALARRGDETSHTFTVFPSSEEMTKTLKAVFTIGGKLYDHSIQTIQYDHIPIQTLLPKAEAKIVRTNLKKEGSTIGYIMGAGDDVPVALRNMGYEVVELKNGEVVAETLKRMDAVVLGVRALNTNDRLRYIMPDLLAYVRAGGTLVVQYNTILDLGNVYTPYPLKLSRERVAEEDAEVRIVKPDHPALNYPNKITAADFEGWVQERGLYFPNSWDPSFEALLSMNDTGEPPRDGSLLIARYGEGHYVYTGLSFFRELPEGVAGAYRLFANLVSLGKQPKKEPATPAKSKRKSN